MRAYDVFDSSILRICTHAETQHLMNEKWDAEMTEEYARHQPSSMILALALYTHQISRVIQTHKFKEPQPVTTTDPHPVSTHPVPTKCR